MRHFTPPVRTTGRANSLDRDPATIAAPARAAASSVKKPWGVAELGRTAVQSDGGERARAAWPRAADEVQGNGGVVATYIDSSVGSDDRLHDQPSRSAWKSVVRR